MENVKVPWYIWLLFPIFVFLFLNTVNKFHKEKKRKKRLKLIKFGSKEWHLDFILEFKIFGQFIKLGLGCFMIPLSILLSVIDFVGINFGLFGTNLLGFIIVLHFYFVGGVYLNYSHWKWQQKNIKHLL